jgi:hypothetical protein
MVFKYYSDRRPNSPKGQVFKVFSEKGADAATAKAEKLDIAPFRVRKWILVWTGKAQAPKATKAAKKPAKKIAAKKVKSKAPAKKKAPAAPKQAEPATQATAAA